MSTARHDSRPWPEVISHQTTSVFTPALARRQPPVWKSPGRRACTRKWILYAAEAIAHLERAHAVEALGIAQIETGQYQLAIANLNAALAEHPNQPDLLYYLGRAAGLLSKRSIDTLIAAYPDSARTHQAMAENYYVLRQMP